MFNTLILIYLFTALIFPSLCYPVTSNLFLTIMSVINSILGQNVYTVDASVMQRIFVLDELGINP